MKSLRFMLPVVLMSLGTVVFAQSDAQKSFDQLKTLAGSWEGVVAGTGRKDQTRQNDASNGFHRLRLPKENGWRVVSAGERVVFTQPGWASDVPFGALS